jgi:hypothetical protein
MKKFLLILALAAASVACQKPDDPVKQATDVSGVWELTNVSTKASVGSVQVSVYLDLVAGGSFTLYQKIGDGRYTVFKGGWKLSEDDRLSGTYEDGKAWGPYEATVSGSSMTLVSAGGKEVDTYKKIASIPDSVTSNTY